MKNVRMTIVFVLFLASWAWSAYSGGAGTAGDPWLINTVADYETLVATSADWNNYFKQIADIDFTTAGDVSCIGYYHHILPSTRFTGTYDGNGYTISNISIGISDRDVESKYAMFGSTGNGAVIKNVTVTNATITGTSPRIDRLGFYAVLVGDNANGALIKNCNINGTITFTYTDSLIGFSGMIVGRNLGTLTDSIASGNITFASTGGTNLWVGGVAGQQWGGPVLVYMTNTTSTVSISCNSAIVASKTYVGGVVGYLEDTDLGGGNFNYNYVSNCHYDGTIDVNNTQTDESMSVGGVAGRNHCILINCSAKGTIIARSSSTKVLESALYPAIAVGGIVGTNNDWIYECYSDCAISMGYATRGYLGGAIGFDTAYTREINDCYSLGSLYDLNTNSTELHIPDGAGGFIGRARTTVNRCWSAPRVTFSAGSGLPIHGFAGDFSNGTFANCFWDTTTSGMTATNSTGIVGKTTAEMKNFATFSPAEWDFVNVWGIGNGQTYPYLKPFNGVNPADIDYSGTVNFADFEIMAANWLD